MLQKQNLTDSKSKTKKKKKIKKKYMISRSDEELKISILPNNPLQNNPLSSNPLPNNPLSNNPSPNNNLPNNPLPNNPLPNNPLTNNNLPNNNLPKNTELKTLKEEIEILKINVNSLQSTIDNLKTKIRQSKNDFVKTEIEYEKKIKDTDMEIQILNQDSIYLKRKIRNLNTTFIDKQNKLNNLIAKEDKKTKEKITIDKIITLNKNIIQKYKNQINKVKNNIQNIKPEKSENLKEKLKKLNLIEIEKKREIEELMKIDELHKNCKQIKDGLLNNLFILKNEYNFEIRRNRKKKTVINIYKRNNFNIYSNINLYASCEEKNILLNKINLSYSSKKITKNKSQILNKQFSLLNTSNIYNPKNQIRIYNNNEYLLSILNFNDSNSIENSNEIGLFTRKEKNNLSKIIPNNYLKICENKFKTIEQDQKKILSKINLRKTKTRPKLDKLEIGENNAIETIKANITLHSKFSNYNKKIMEIQQKIKIMKNQEKLLDINYEKKLRDKIKYEEE